MNRYVLDAGSDFNEEKDRYCGEQLSRAEILKKYLKNQILSYDELTPERISRLILRVKKSRIETNIIPLDWLEVYKKTSKLIFAYANN